MTLLLLLAGTSIILGIKSRYVKPAWSIFFFLISILIFLTWLVEYNFLGNIDFFVSDEIKYVEWGESFIWSDFFSDRGLWGAINHWLLKLDVSTGDYGLKIINIFFMYFTLVLLTKVYLEKRIFITAMIFLPYIFVIAIHNLRDTLILLLFTSCVYSLTKEKKALIYGFISLFLLLFLRPIFVGIAVLIILINLFWIFLISLSKGRFKLRLTMSVILILLLLGPIAYSKLEFAMNRATLNIEEGGKRLERMEEQGYATGNRLRDLVVAGSRYVLTPIPLSTLQRLFAGGSEDWGVLDDMIRVWNQSGYYLLLIYILFRWKTAVSVIRKMTAPQLSVIMSLFIYMPIYSLHLYGVCHQRLKLPFQLAVMIIAVLVWQYRKKNKKEIKSQENYF